MPNDMPVAPSRIEGNRGSGHIQAWSPDVPTLLFDDPKKGGSGSYCINPSKPTVQWRWLPVVGRDSQHSGGADGFPVDLDPLETYDAQIVIGRDGQKGDTEIGAFMIGTSAGRVAVQPYVSSPIDKYLSNVPLSSALLAGTAQLPGFLTSPVYSMAGTSWTMKMQNLVNAPNLVSMVAWGRVFQDGGDAHIENQRRRAALLNVVWPYWIGPQGQQASLTGPEITLATDETVTIRFPMPKSYDFLLKWLLDDSSSTTGVAPLLFVSSIQEEDTGKDMIDGLPSGSPGLSWTDFLSCPTVTIPGFPSGGIIRAFSLGSPRAGWTQLLKRTSALNITFVSQDPGTITLRPALCGWSTKACEPEDRHYANTPEMHDIRHAQAAARGSSPVRLYGQPGA